MSNNWQKIKVQFWLWAPLCVIFSSVCYLAVRITLFMEADYAWHEKTLGGLLLLAEIFLLLHGILYFTQMRRVLVQQKNTGTKVRPPRYLFEPGKSPSVALIVASYHEPLGVLESTLACLNALIYPNKHVVLLDDTRYDPGDEEALIYGEAMMHLCKRFGVTLFRHQWRGAKAGMINDFLNFATLQFQEGYEFFIFDPSFDMEPPDYIAIFDADQNPMPGFLTPLVEMMEKNPSLAFVQTPQYYTNYETNRVARSAGLQQVVFYEYICEGKSEVDAMFCCGTNVLFRRKALEDVGGLDEFSVTEDIVTSLKFHMRGWLSRYYPSVGVFGMGPQELGGYFKQQFRWALGTIGLLRTVLKRLVQSPRSMRPSQWVEYTVSSTFYFIGFVNVILMACPIAYIFFSSPTYFGHPGLYFGAFVPYMTLSLALYFVSLRSRHYKARDILLGQLLIVISTPVFLKAALYGIIGVKGKFAVTNKAESGTLPWWQLRWQLFIFFGCFSAFVWALNRMFYEPGLFFALLVNAFWALYYCVVFSFVFYFNHPEEQRP